MLQIATATAVKLAAKPPSALRTHKRLLKLASMGPLQAAVTAEGREFEERVVSAEAKEAFSAFFEKRPPDFAKAATAAASKAA